MKKLTYALLAGLIALPSVAFGAMAEGEDTAPGPVEQETPAPAARPAAPAIQLKKQSTFAAEGDSRNPFWPIGWKPSVQPVAGNKPEAPAADISPNAFLVSSIMMGEGSRFAIINGKAMQEGQIFGLQAGGQIYQVTVKSIEDGQVILQRRDQELAVPLRRK